MFCYRHALELHLKAVLPAARRHHKLGDLASSLRPYLDGRYPADQVKWLIDRIAEFDRMDPRSTVFRYPDGASTSRGMEADPWPETWVDFRRLQRAMSKVFKALDHIRLAIQCR